MTFAVTPRFNVTPTVTIPAMSSPTLSPSISNYRFTVSPTAKITTPTGSQFGFGKTSFYSFPAGGRAGGAANGTATPAVPQGGLTPSQMMMSDEKLAQLTENGTALGTAQGQTNLLLLIGAVIVLLVVFK